jgi:tyrosyl-tRNA synthetase
MLSFDSVKLRLEREQELSFLEFNYMILQAYDYVELAQALRLQPADGRLRPVGQHRQRHRSRPAHGHAQLFALTSPLITTSSGAKMGKTAQGAVWLNADHGQPLRLLAVLAQHRGRRRRAAS